MFAGVRKEADKRSVLETCSKVADAATCKRVVPIILDVTKASTIESSLAEIKAWTTEVWPDDLLAHVVTVLQKQQPFVALVNNAGVSKIGLVEAMPLEDFRGSMCDLPLMIDASLGITVFEVNYFGLVALTQAFLPLIRASKGRVVNVGSVAGLVGSNYNAAYCSSKFAVEGFSDSLRKELLPLGVSVSLVDPAYVTTPIFGKSGSDVEALQSEKWQAIYGSTEKLLLLPALLVHAHVVKEMLHAVIGQHFDVESFHGGINGRFATELVI